MDKSKKKTAGIIFVVAIGIAACLLKLWMSANASTAVVYADSDVSVAVSSDLSFKSGQNEQATGVPGISLETLPSMNPTNQVNPTNQGAVAASGESAGSLDLAQGNQNLAQKDLDATTLEEAVNSTSKSIPVYLCGAVSNPGIYHIIIGSYLYEVIDLAGGLLPEAAADNINLVYQFSAAVSIYIPSIKEMKSFLDGNESSTSGYLRNGLLQGIWGGGKSDSLPASEGSLSNSQTSESTNSTIALININTADQKQLETLPGVGETTAKAIISYREKSGGFAKIEDIMNVSGIKEGRFEAIREFITV